MESPLVPQNNGQNGKPALPFNGALMKPDNNYPPDYSGYGERQEEGFKLRELWRKVLRRKWLVLTIMLIITIIAAIQVSQLKNIYSATATIELGRDERRALRLDESYFYSDDSDIVTGLFLLKSRPLLEDVAANLRLDQNPKFLDVTKRRSLWEVITRTEQNSVDDDDDIIASQLTKADFGAKRSQDEIARLAPYIGILRNGLKVERVRGARLISINYTHTDPEIAAAVANNVGYAFRERSFRTKTETVSNTSEWLDKSTRKLESQLRQAEQDLADYTRRNGIFAADAKEDLTTSKLATLHSQVMKAETDRLLKQSLYDEVKQGRVAQLPEAFANPVTGELQKKLSELTVQAAQLSVKFGSKNPKVIEVKEQMAAIQQEIDKSRGTLEERLRADFERAVRDEGQLRSALDRAKTEAVQQNQKAIQYNVLRQNVDTAKTLYDDFLKKTSQANIEVIEQNHTVTMAEPAAVPGSPVGPNRLRTVLIAFILSLAIGIGLVYLLDHLDNTVKTVEDVTRYARVPTLGVIPAITSSQARLLHGRFTGKQLGAGKGAGGGMVVPQSSVALATRDFQTIANVTEAYRMLRTSVLMAAAGHPPKTILFTSSRPGEGKTTTTANTAISLAQLGAKVLVIDADMRRPRVHKVFHVDHKRGLSTYLSSRTELEKLIVPGPVKNLYVLSSGLIPPNSAELLSSEKMRELLQQLTESFDHILIDSPPVSSVTDPIIISRLVDGVVIVVHGGKATRELLHHTRQELSNAGAKVFGVVLNNVDLRRDGYDYYAYRYQYGYGSYGSTAGTGGQERQA